MKNFQPLIVVLMMLTMSLPGCMPHREKVEPLYKKEDRERKAAAAKKQKEVPPAESALTEEELKTKEGIIAKDSNKDALFSISVNAANVRDVLRAFARDSQLSIVIDPDVQGEITVDLKQVTLEQLLFFILDPLELDYTRENNIIRISTRKLQTRIFTVNHLLITRATSGTIEVNQFSENIATGETSITSESKSDFWNGLEEQLKKLIIGEEGGDAAAGAAAADGAGTESVEPGSTPVPKAGEHSQNQGEANAAASERVEEKPQLIVHRTSGLILIKAKPDKLEAAAEYLELIEGSAHRQVRIEAKIAEVTLDDSHQLGIDWNVLDTSKFDGDPITAGQQGVFTQPGIVPTLDPASGFFSVTFEAEKSGFVLDALKKQGDINVLSSPSIATLNNQPALIKVAREEVFFSTTESREDQDGKETITYTTEQQKVTIGIVLRVTPQIGNDDQVMMDVHPVITELVRTASVSAPNGQILASAPIVDVREINVVVKVPHRNTVVIGGLMREREVSMEVGIPLLSSIPILGELFKRTEYRNEKNELAIFLTPIITYGRSLQDITEKERRQLQDRNAKVFNRL